MKLPFLAFFSACTLFAQNASLVGVVKDAQDAAIPGVSVTLTNTETQVTQSTKSDDAGLYEFSIVRPGNYSLKAERAGFKGYVRNDLVLAVDQRGRADIA